MGGAWRNSAKMRGAFFARLLELSALRLLQPHSTAQVPEMCAAALASRPPSAPRSAPPPADRPRSTLSALRLGLAWYCRFCPCLCLLRGSKASHTHRHCERCGKQSIVQKLHCLQRRTALLGRRIGHLARYDLDLVHIQQLGIVELERGVAHTERPHLLAQAVVLQVSLYIQHQKCVSVHQYAEGWRGRRGVQGGCLP